MDKLIPKRDELLVALLFAILIASAVLCWMMISTPPWIAHYVDWLRTLT
jgi:hypothetical protein